MGDGMIAADGKKETGMLFKGPLVRALLDGSKTQTRRLVGGVALEWLSPDLFNPEFVSNPANGLCPYGYPGDRLWVRETLGHDSDKGHYYAATGMHIGPLLDYEQEPPPSIGLPAKTIPSIHMPRWACRILLEITSVRVERLQDISAGDAYDEGTQEWAAAVVRDGNKFSSILSAFRALWESTGGDWDANPWVWVIEFKRVTP